VGTNDLKKERPNVIHELKCWPDPFKAILFFNKKHEIRKADRDYKVGDALYLREYDPKTGVYTGATIQALVTYLTPAGEWGLPPDICVMSIVMLSHQNKDNAFDVG
jgi:Domain of unknown function (DUF3850)